LRGENGEVGRERVRLAIDRHAPFLHGLEQGGLGLGRCPIDFIGEKKSGEHRSRNEGEFVALQVEDAGAGDVGRHQVGRELNPIELPAENPGQGADEKRLGHARHPLDECVMAGKYRDERFVYDIILTNDDLAHLRPRTVEGIVDLLGFSRHWMVGRRGNYSLPNSWQIAR
jgi:hypothetical protein